MKRKNKTKNKACATVSVNGRGGFNDTSEITSVNRTGGKQVKSAARYAHFDAVKLSTLDVVNGA